MHKKGMIYSLDGLTTKVVDDVFNINGQGSSCIALAKIVLELFHNSLRS